MKASWSFFSDSIISLDDLDETKMFLISNNELIMLDPEGNRFESSIEKRYHITNDSKNIKKIEPPKEVAEVNEGFYQEKYLKGVDFIARGNEPNWNLEIDFEKAMRFATMDDIKLNTPSVEKTNTSKEGVTNYKAKTDSGELKVTITADSCQDNMSGEYFTHKVKVEIKKNDNKDYTIFNGCGKYLFDYRLNDVWVMDDMNGVNLKKAKLTKGFPTFEFNLSKMSFNGYAGCNRLNGNIVLVGNKLKFENMVGTLMICPDTKMERAIIDALNSKTFTYKIDKEKLFLESGKTKMVFKKGELKYVLINSLKHHFHKLACLQLCKNYIAYGF